MPVATFARTWSIRSTPRFGERSYHLERQLRLGVACGTEYWVPIFESVLTAQICAGRERAAADERWRDSTH